MTIDDVRALAWNVCALPSPARRIPRPDANGELPAIYKYWLANPDVGTRMTDEIVLNDGTTALITATGHVLHWVGGDTVLVDE